MARVVITGIGLVTPAGSAVPAFWQRLLEGPSTAATIDAFDPSAFRSQIACKVTGFDPLAFFDKRTARRLDPFILYAMAAADMAMVDAGFDDGRVPEDQAEDWGVYVGSGMGGLQQIEKTHTTLLSDGPRHGIGPRFVPDVIVNMAAGQISIRTGARGPNICHVSACSTGAHSIGEAARLIERGDAVACLAGGTDADITPLGIGGFSAMRALSTRNDDPTRASRPFDKERDGFVMGEGAAVLVLESEDNARRRGADILAVISGYAATSDAHHITAPDPEGKGAARCMVRALKDAKIGAEEVSYLNAHGTSTAMNDKLETAAIKNAFGVHAATLAVSSTKSTTGHLLGAAGAVELAACVLAIKHQVAPPTVNYEFPDPECDLDYVPNEARDLKIDYAMSNSLGFGGTNACVVVGKYNG